MINLDEEESFLTCPVCGKGQITKKQWQESESRSLRGRATWWPSFARKDKAWFWKDHINQPSTPEHGLIEEVSFGRCGYQEIEMGLTMTLKLEGGGDVCWTMFNYGNVAELFERAKANKLKDLVGTPIIAYFAGRGGVGTSIIGFDVVDNMVIRKS